MPIKVACKCGQKFAAKDELAGKTVKCPKCGDPIKISAATGEPATAKPQAQQQAPAPARQPAKAQDDDMLQLAAPSAPRIGGDPFLNDLLLEAGVTSDIHHSGPRCPGCNAPIQPDAILCVKCGYDVRTGHRIKTHVGQTSQFGHLSGGANAEEAIKRAEEEIAERPIETSDADYGDMLTATLLTGGLLVLTVITVGLGYVLFRWVDVSASSNTGIAMIMFMIGCPFYLIGKIWIHVLSFMESTTQGLLVLLAPCYIFYWAFTHLGTAGLPCILFLVGYMMYIFGAIMMNIGDAQETDTSVPVPFVRVEQELACIRAGQREESLPLRSKFDRTRSSVLKFDRLSHVEVVPCELSPVSRSPWSLAL